MYKNKRVLGIIPARGGSKGIPRKNLYELNTYPLIYYSINSALQSSIIDEVIVSTDDSEIAQVAKKHNATIPFMRPSFLAEDESSSMDVLLHAVEHFESLDEYFDIIVMLEPTSPLRKKNDIDTSLESFINSYEKYDSVISVGRIHLENPVITKTIKDSFVVPFIDSPGITRRQEYPDVFFPYGVIYAVKTNVLKEQKTVYTERSMPYYIERWQNYEIDDIYDLICVNQIMKAKEKEII